MTYQTAQHQPPGRFVEQSGMLHPVAELIASNNIARLAELGLFRHVTTEGAAPLGYTAWAESSDADGVLYTREPDGTHEERQEAALQQARESMSCSDLQALLAIDALGMSDDYEAWASDPARTFAEKAFVQRAKTWKRLDATFIAAADAWGKTEDEKDAFFELAKTL